MKIDEDYWFDKISRGFIRRSSILPTLETSSVLLYMAGELWKSPYGSGAIGKAQAFDLAYYLAEFKDTLFHRSLNSISQLFPDQINSESTSAFSYDRHKRSYSPKEKKHPKNAELSRRLIYLALRDFDQILQVLEETSSDVGDYFNKRSEDIDKRLETFSTQLIAQYPKHKADFCAFPAAEIYGQYRFCRMLWDTANYLLNSKYENYEAKENEAFEHLVESFCTHVEMSFVRTVQDTSYSLSHNFPNRSYYKADPKQIVLIADLYTQALLKGEKLLP